MTTLDSSQQRTLAALDIEIDDGPWLNLFARADIYEEAGDHILAAGYRWLAQNRKQPSLNNIGGTAWEWFMAAGDSTASNTLHAGICAFWQYDTVPDWQCKRSTAFLQAARAVGRWLTEKVSNVRASARPPVEPAFPER